MKISQIKKATGIIWSFEIFPPKPASDISVMEKTVAELAALKPDFISVTCSAGGSGNSRTAEIAGILKNKSFSSDLRYKITIKIKISMIPNVHHSDGSALSPK